MATLDRLLAVCGQELSSERKLGEGVDRSVMRSLLELSPRERADRAVIEARNFARFGASR